MEDEEKVAETEELKEYIEELREKTENLDDIPMLREKLEIPKDEIHISDVDDDFSNIVKKRDYHGRVEMNVNNHDGEHKKRRLKKWVYLLLLIPLIIIGVIVGLVIHHKNVERKLAEEKTALANILQIAAAALTMLLTLVCAAALISDGYNPFLYFRFWLFLKPTIWKGMSDETFR